MDAQHLDSIINQLSAHYDRGFGVNDLAGLSLPDRPTVARICDTLLQVMFPGFFTVGGVDGCDGDHKRVLRRLLVDLEDDLHRQMIRARRFENHCRGSESGPETENRVKDKLQTFMTRLPAIRDLLETDVEAAFHNDPAAASRQDIIVSYPCIEAIAVQRLAHELYLLAVPFIPRMMTEVAHSRTGIDIHPGATIGESFFIDHGTGVVIGETTTIGPHVVLYHGVTLGAFNPLVKNAAGELTRGLDNKRHPDLEHHVTVYPGATILGGSTRIGHHSIIGGNAWITESVAPYSAVTIADPQLRIRQKNSSSSKTDFAI